MSITVSKCLKLLSMKDAKVVAGSDGLNKLVSSVSVLEYADVSALKSELFIGNEFIISAFVNIKDDVAMQCEVLRKLDAQGVVAVAVYYVGVFLPKIDKRLMKVADELSMPLIMMPEKRFDYRYGEAISEILNTIYTSQRQETFFVPQILENIYGLSERNRTMGTLLRILSNRLHCTIAAMDKNQNILEAATWPASQKIEYKKLINDSNPMYYVQKVEVETINYFVIQNKNAAEVEFDEYILQQIAESIRLFINFSEYPKRVQSTDAMVEAIINADGYLMNRIAEHTDISTKSLENMWILFNCDVVENTEIEIMKLSTRIRMKSFLLEKFKEPIVGARNDIVVMFMGAPLKEGLEVGSSEEFLKTFEDVGNEMILVCSPKLATTIDARDFYIKAKEHWYTLKTIFPEQRIFNGNELKFAESCQNICLHGDGEMKKNMLPIEPLVMSEKSDDLVRTLETYFLDAGSSLSRTADLMFLHQSTVKYRLKSIKSRLQCDITKLPDSYEIYQALAIRRLFRAL